MPKIFQHKKRPQLLESFEQLGSLFIYGMKTNALVTPIFGFLNYFHFMTQTGSGQATSFWRSSSLPVSASRL